MSVRAKFTVGPVIHHGGGRGEVIMNAVTTGSKENESFWKYTPSGELKMFIDNQDALDQFTPGQEFYLDLTPAEKE